MTSLRVTTSPWISKSQSADDVQRLVQHHLLAALDLLDVDLGRDADAQLAAVGEDVGGRVLLVRLEEDAVAGRGLGELLDLFLQGNELLARFAQGGRRAARCFADALRFGAGLGEPLLESVDLTGGRVELAASERELVLEQLDLTLKLLTSRSYWAILRSSRPRGPQPPP